MKPTRHLLISELYSISISLFLIGCLGHSFFILNGSTPSIIFLSLHFQSLFCWLVLLNFSRGHRKPCHGFPWSESLWPGSRVHERVSAVIKPYLKTVLLTFSLKLSYKCTHLTRLCEITTKNCFTSSPPSTTGFLRYFPGETLNQWMSNHQGGGVGRA